MFDWLKILYQTQSQDANAKQLAKHLSKVLQNGCIGIDALYPDLKDKTKLLLEKMSTLQMDIQIVETFRTCKRQDELYAQGRTMAGNIVTNAKGLQSYHNYGLAFDFRFVKWGYSPPNPEIIKTLADKATKLGLVWGGSFGDSYHLEWHPGFIWNDIEKYFEV